MKLSVPRRLVRTRGMRGQCHRDTVLTPLRRGGGGRLFSTRSVPPYRPATSPPPGTDTSIIRIAPIQPVGCARVFGGSTNMLYEALSHECRLAIVVILKRDIAIRFIQPFS